MKGPRKSVFLSNSSKKLRAAVFRAFGSKHIEEVAVESWAQELQFIINRELEREQYLKSNLKDLENVDYLIFEDGDYPGASILTPILREQIRYVDALLAFLGTPSPARNNAALVALPVLHPLYETFSPDASSERGEVFSAFRDRLEELRAILDGAVTSQISYESERALHKSKSWGSRYLGLLNRVCIELGVRPTLGTDSMTRRPNGNLFKLAKETQLMLPVVLRSESDEVLGDLLRYARRKSKKIQRDEKG